METCGLYLRLWLQRKFLNSLAVPVNGRMKVQTRWVKKNVDLEELSKRVEEFYKSKGSEVLVERLGGAFKVTGVMRVGDRPRSSFVSISGSPDDFTIEFLGSQLGRFSQFLTPLITMLGGGVFILDRLRSQEFYEKLETEFWAFVEHAVEQAATPQLGPSRG